MRVLVTGGAGFVGSHVVEVLEAAGHETVVLDLRATGCPRDRVGDITDAATVVAAVRGVDAVCHQAAKVGLGVDFGDAPDYVAQNDLGTAVLLRTLHDVHFVGRIVLASSMVVYGEGRYRCVRHGLVRPAPRTPETLARGEYEPPCPECGAALTPEAVPEDAPMDPRNVYAATKLHQEHLCAAFAREHPEVTVVALRYHNVYGPRMPRDTPYAGVAALFCDASRRGEPPHVFEDGGQSRDFVHVQDVARANLRALEAEVVGVEACNIASGTPRSVLNMADALVDAFGPDAARPLVVGGWRPGDVRHVFASPERARAVLGFTAEVPFEAGMRELAVDRCAAQ